MRDPRHLPRVNHPQLADGHRPDNKPRESRLRLGAITLQIALKNPAGITMQSWARCAGQDELEQMQLTHRLDRPSRGCVIYTQGCTDPSLPNEQVAVIYTDPQGTKHVRYVTTDEDGCYLDMFPVGETGLWETQVVLEEEDCRAEARTPPQVVLVEETAICGGPWWCCLLWALLVVALFMAALAFGVAVRGAKRGWYAFFIALLLAVSAAYLMLTYCTVALCWLLLSITLALLLACVILCCRTRNVERTGYPQASH